MIYLVTGVIDSGKTQKMRSLYRESGKGDGFISPKSFERSTFVGYDIMRLSSQKRKPLAYLLDFIPPHWDEAYRYGRFSFSRSALLFAEEIISDILLNRIDPVYIDEIGPLELEGKGFYEILQVLLQTERTIYISIRSSLIEEIVQTFGLEKYKVIYRKDRRDDRPLC
jgi:nucleoside-triphosphatase THEP1